MSRCSDWIHGFSQVFDQVCNCALGCYDYHYWHALHCSESDSGETVGVNTECNEPTTTTTTETPAPVKTPTPPLPPPKPTIVATKLVDSFSDSSDEDDDDCVKV